MWRQPGPRVTVCLPPALPTVLLQPAPATTTTWAASVVRGTNLGPPAVKPALVTSDHPAT